MSSVLVLTDAIEALLPTSLNAYFDGAKPPDDDAGRHSEDNLPWVVVNIRLPLVLSRSTAGTEHAARVDVTTTIAGLNATSVRAVYDTLYPALAGARPQAPGWRCSPLLQRNARAVEVDRDMTFIASNAQARFVVIEWETTVSRGGSSNGPVHPGP